MPELIARFDRVARKYLDCFAPNTCFEQVRILIECLRAFRVAADPVSCGLVVECREFDLAYVSGLTPELMAQAKATSKLWTDLAHPNGHQYGYLVADADLGGNHYLLDLTLFQANHRGLRIPRETVAVPVGRRINPGMDISAGMRLDNGTELNVRWIVSDSRAFEEVPGWEPSHLWPLIHRIVREMKAA